MSAGSMATRVTRGMALVAFVSAVLLALTASLAARLIWQAREQRELALAADAVAAAIDREAEEHGQDRDAAIAEALRESTLPGYRAEVWRGGERVATSASGADAAAPAGPAGAWPRHTRVLPDGLTLVLTEPPDHAARAVGVFAIPFLIAAPACLLVAVLVGRAVARRATLPLRDLQSRIALAQGLAPLPASPLLDVPVEISDLEDAFRALWARQQEALRRESEFAANASHELRTPLTRIRLQAERALADAGPTARAALTSQADEVDRLTRLVDSLLVLARDAAAGIPHGEAVNLADVCRRVAARASHDARGADCRFPDEALVRGDDALIEIAVENLLDNARKFASGDAPIRAVLDPDGASFRLEVATPGARVPADERERLFDRFHRGAGARALVNGHGLGLALARHIARLHGGEVACVSGEAEDARFALTLPQWTAQRGEEG